MDQGASRVALNLVDTQPSSEFDAPHAVHDVFIINACRVPKQPSANPIMLPPSFCQSAPYCSSSSCQAHRADADPAEPGLLPTHFVQRHGTHRRVALNLVDTQLPSEFDAPHAVHDVSIINACRVPKQPSANLHEDSCYRPPRRPTGRWFAPGPRASRSCWWRHAAFTPLHVPMAPSGWKIPTVTPIAT